MSAALHPFVSRHPGATALLFGKGPSLDAFLAGEGEIRLPWGNPIVIALLNDTLAYRAEIIRAVIRRAGPHLHGSECVGGLDRGTYVYAFANDAVTSWRHLYRAGDVLFQPFRTVAAEPGAIAGLPCSIVPFPDSGGTAERLGWPISRRAVEPLVAGHGTCDSAAQILAIMGCTALVAVGCDGRGGRSVLPWCTPMRGDHLIDYALIRRDFCQILMRLDLPTEFFGEPSILTSSGQWAHQVVRPVAVAGVHLEPGAIVPAPIPGRTEPVLVPA